MKNVGAYCIRPKKQKIIKQEGHNSLCPYKIIKKLGNNLRNLFLQAYNKLRIYIIIYRRRKINKDGTIFKKKTNIIFMEFTLIGFLVIFFKFMI
jgi:hypothetical protein